MNNRADLYIEELMNRIKELEARNKTQEELYQGRLKEYRERIEELENDRIHRRKD